MSPDISGSENTSMIWAVLEPCLGGQLLQYGRKLGRPGESLGVESPMRASCPSSARDYGHRRSTVWRRLALILKSLRDDTLKPGLGICRALSFPPRVTLRPGIFGG